MAWENTPASNSLVNEFNAAFPNRSKASDGTIGDSEHSTRSSNHNPDETGKTPREDSDSANEVHARDTDKDLNRSGWNMQRCVDIILGRCRSGVEKRLFEIIWNRYIYTEAYGWSKRPYSGDNPHTEHAHFSFKYGSGSGSSNPENITSPWGILAAIEEEQGVQLDQDDIIAIGNEVWGKKRWSSASPVSTADALQQAALADDAMRAVSDLTALVIAQTDATAQEIAEALAPLLLAGMPEAALTIEDVETAVANVLRQGTDTHTP